MRVHVSARQADVLVPSLVLAVGLVEMVLTRYPGWGYGVVLETLSAAVLMARRRWPLVVLPAAAAVLLFMPWVGPQLDDLATPILFLALMGYTAGRWVADLRGIGVIVAIMGVVVFDLVTVDARTTDATDLVFVGALLVPPYVFGRIARRLARQSEELARHQERERARAVLDERDRIARDLHDVLAHSLSAMTVQTAAAQDLVRSDPDRAAAMLDDVAATGRRALAETGRLLHVLRDEAGELGLAPSPGLADVPTLVAGFRVQGLAVEADLPEPLPALPGGLDVSAYRIVQEALTNALRYAPDRAVRLRVRCSGPDLVVEAANRSDGRTGLGSGLGLIGLAERVSVHGGRLTRREEDGRFEVVATLPTGSP